MTDADGWANVCRMQMEAQRAMLATELTLARAASGMTLDEVLRRI